METKSSNLKKKNHSANEPFWTENKLFEFNELLKMMTIYFNTGIASTIHGFSDPMEYSLNSIHQCTNSHHPCPKIFLSNYSNLVHHRLQESKGKNWRNKISKYRRPSFSTPSFNPPVSKKLIPTDTRTKRSQVETPKRYLFSKSSFTTFLMIWRYM